MASNLDNIERFGEGVHYAENNYKGESNHLVLDKALFKEKFNLAGKKVLDFGCGMGGMTLWMAENWDCRIKALDIDKYHIEIAKHLQNKYKIDNVDFMLQNILEKPINEKFELITLNDVAEHIELGILRKVIFALKDHLAEGGQIFMSYPPWEGPYGSHLDKITSIPWPQYLPKKFLFSLIEKRNQVSVGRNDVMTDYLELNHLTHKKLTNITNDAGLKIDFRISHTKLNKLSAFKNINFNVFPFNLLVSKEMIAFRK